MELPTDEEDDEQVVGVPELFETAVGLAAALLHRVPDHDTKSDVHDPARGTGAGGEVGAEEDEEELAIDLMVGHNQAEASEVDHVSGDVDNGEEDDGPGSRFVCNGKSIYIGISEIVAAVRKVMFLSNGTTSFKGVRRRMEMKLRQMGSMMNATSTWRTKAAERAIAVKCEMHSISS